MSLGIPDPMAMWHWVNDMNRGCGKIEDFPGNQYKPPPQMFMLQGGGPCIYSPAGGKQINPDIETSLFSRYGVILTVECDPTLGIGIWRQAQRIDFLRMALDMTDHKLRVSTGSNFRDMFGGLEFRLVPGGVGGVAKATNSGLVEISGPNHFIVEENIIHELGHIAEQRTQQSGANGMATVASIRATTRTDDTWIVPPGQTVRDLGPNIGLGPDPLLEAIADIFMFWIMGTWTDPIPLEPLWQQATLRGRGLLVYRLVGRLTRVLECLSGHKKRNRTSQIYR